MAEPFKDLNEERREVDLLMRKRIRGEKLTRQEKMILGHSPFGMASTCGYSTTFTYAPPNEN